MFAAAATAFSRDGYDGVGVDDIARAAGVNKAMLYYHFGSKLELYHEVVRDMLRAVRSAVGSIAEAADPAPAKIGRFIEALAHLRESRPWFPPLMMREMSAGGPRLDPDTLALMRGVFLAFVAILDAGVTARAFRPVNPVLAYVTILGPLMMNAVRERAAAEPGRAHLPMFAAVDRHEIVAHVQETALRMLTPAPASRTKDRSR
ncbi:MAG: helix-turn-helix domain-containing protein [Vicinamibacterales bacterium]